MLLSGCANTRFLEDGQVLFKKNKVVFIDEQPDKKPKELSSELEDISQLQPNKKFFGITKLRLWFHNVASQRKETKFRSWMKYKVGEPPVLYDSLYAQRSISLMENYLENNGYFYASVDYASVIKKKKATLVYLVDLGERYYINNVVFPKGQNPVSLIARQHMQESKIKPCTPFSVADLKAERERITTDMRNEGYFYFNREYVNFDLDSNETEKNMDVFVRILPPSDSTEHKIYYINNVYIQTDFSVEKLKTVIDYDTLQVDEYYFISEELKYKPEALIRSIHFDKDEKYSRRDYQATLNHLSDLGVFRFINIKFVPADTVGTYGPNYLDCLITLTPSKKQEWGVEAEVNNNTAFLLGLALTFSYRNKNIFKGAELLEFTVTGGFETNFDQGRNFFNTVDLTANANLYFNKFLVPFRMRRLSEYFRPKTILSLRNSFLSRINFYTVSTTTVSFGYDWRKSQNQRHILTPISINLVRVLDQSAAFEEILARSQSLKNSFTEQLIIGWDYTYLFTTRPEQFKRTSFFFRANADVAGNLVHGIQSLVRIKRDDALPYKMFNIPYAQYVLFNIDGRNYLDVGKQAQLVSRLYGGIGVSYGNSDALPYIKQFFSGGSNGIRAWRVRTLGPGSFVFEESAVADQDNFFFDQTGDIKLEMNLEMRFPIFRFVKGAVFADAGNIWTLRADTLRPGANFEFNRFYKEIALGIGIGARMDFTYFVLRFDVGVPVHDPGAPGNNWIIRNFSITDRDRRREFLKFNLAIGYPF